MPKVAWFQEGPGLRNWQWTTDGIKVINGRNVLSDGQIDLSNTDKFISWDEYRAKYQHFGIERNDILVTSSGTLGKVGRVKTAHLPLMMNTSVIRFRPNESGALDADYLYCYLRSADFQAQIQAYAIGAAQPNFGPSHLKQMTIPLPPLVAQRRIADILSAYDDLIGNCQRRIEILDQMARALYREWFVKFRYPGHESVPLVSSPLGEIPKGWRVSSIGDACSRLESGGTPRRNVADLWNDGDIDWYTTSELQDNYLFVSKERITEKAVQTSTARVFESGTILMAIYGSPTVGRLGVLTRRSSCNQAALGLIADSRVISQNYLYFLLQSLRGYFNSIAQGAAQQNISKEKVSKTMIVVPDAAARELFDASASAFRDETRVLTETMLNLSRTRDLLLPRLISGQLEVDAA